MESNQYKQGKNAAIIAYLTIFGTLVAIYMSNQNKNSLSTFHTRQAFGLWITFYLLGSFVSLFTNTWLISGPFYLFIFILILYGLIAAFKEEQKMVPLLGEYFQKWFTFIG